MKQSRKSPVPESIGNRPELNTDMLLGELIAEVRGAKHATNNLSQQVAAIGPIAETAREALRTATEVKEELAAHHSRIAVLEADKNRREGAIGLVEWLSRH
jgi:hypothetical protein